MVGFLYHKTFGTYMGSFVCYFITVQSGIRSQGMATIVTGRAVLTENLRLGVDNPLTFYLICYCATVEVQHVGNLSIITLRKSR